MKYFSTIFKYAVDNNLFDERCLDDYDIDEISNIGFDGLFDNAEHYNRYVNNKISFNGNVYNTINETKIDNKTFYTQNPSKIDLLYGGDCVTITDSVIKQLNTNTSITHIDDITTIFSNNYNSNSVINTKCVNITLNVDEANKNDVEFIDKYVLPYLEQMLPLNTIVSINRQHFNPPSTTFKCTYETNKSDEIISLFNNGFDINYIVDVVVDDVYYGNICDSKFNFKNKGKHDVQFNLTTSCNSLENMFKNCYNLTEIVIKDVSLNGITSFNNMFGNCSNLVNLIFENVKCDDVETTVGMFNQCIKLENVKFNETYLSNLIDTQGMFYNCQSLSTIDLSHMICDKLNIMDNMFYNCTNLTEILLPSSNDYIDNNGSITYMKNTFENCQKLESIDFSKVNTNMLKNITDCFKNCLSFNRIAFSYGIEMVDDYENVFSNTQENGVFISYNKFGKTYNYDILINQLPNWQFIEYIEE